MERMMSRGSVGIAVVGYGYWGPNLVRNFANIDGAEVIAVSDLDAAKTVVSEATAAGNCDNNRLSRSS